MPPSVGSPLLWAGFTVFVLLLLALDLGLFHRKAHQIHYAEAVAWTLFWIALAGAFDAGVYLHFGRQYGLEFLTGYVIEYALSVDNIFIFLLIFRYFAVPSGYQHRVLFWGILGALVMRFLFIILGTALLHRFEWVSIFFGAFVVFAGFKMLKEEEVEVHPERNLLLRIFRRFVPVTTRETGGKLIVRRDGRTYATPLLLVLIVMEATDLVFATDSIPAVFAVTRDPFIAFTSNIFAIVGLRSLYFVISGIIDRFAYLKWGLGFVLIFVGLKMVLSDYFVIPIDISLAIVGGLLGASLLVSLFRKPARSPAPRSAEEPPSSQGRNRK